MFRAISEIRPTWVVGENVAGITTMVEGGVLSDLGCHPSLFQEGDNLHGYELEQTFTIERICRDLESLGYSVQPMLIPAAGVGAPHRRDRIFIIAFDADSDRSNDQGATGGYEGEGEGEGLQERHSLRKPGEPDQLRSKIQGIDQDTICDGLKELGISKIHGGGTLAQEIMQNEKYKQLLPTPTCNDAVNNSLPKSQVERADSITKRILSGEIESNYCPNTDGSPFRLSPLFTEEMMGFPFLWTTLPFLRQDGGTNPSKPTETQ